MSTFDKNNESVWSKFGQENLDTKHEKCRNITEEIYKRINITFEIKKLENVTQSHESELSDQIDSNELSNGTDLFACDKSDSIPSSNDEKPIVERPLLVKCINNNNNEERKAPPTKRPKKRFRKRVKKHQLKRTGVSSWSSDEALPASGAEASNSKPKILAADKKNKQKEMLSSKETKTQEKKNKSANLKTTPGNTEEKEESSKTASEHKSSNVELKSCEYCNLMCRGEKGLRRHVAMTHALIVEENKKIA